MNPPETRDSFIALFAQEWFREKYRAYIRRDHAGVLRYGISADDILQGALKKLARDPRKHQKIKAAFKDILTKAAIDEARVQAAELGDSSRACQTAVNTILRERFGEAPKGTPKLSAEHRSFLEEVRSKASRVLLLNEGKRNEQLRKILDAFAPRLTGLAAEELHRFRVAFRAGVVEAHRNLMPPVARVQSLDAARDGQQTQQQGLEAADANGAGDEVETGSKLEPVETVQLESLVGSAEATEREHSSPTTILSLYDSLTPNRADKIGRRWLGAVWQASKNLGGTGASATELRAKLPYLLIDFPNESAMYEHCRAELNGYFTRVSLSGPPSPQFKTSPSLLNEILSVCGKSHQHTLEDFVHSNPRFCEETGAFTKAFLVASKIADKLFENRNCP